MQKYTNMYNLKFTLYIYAYFYIIMVFLKKQIKLKVGYIKHLHP